MGGELYRNKVRVRVSGILVQSSSILLVKVHSPVTNELVWMPPGGGLEFGESLEECLEREFLEETGARIKVGEFLFLNELIDDPYHAVELYYKVRQTGGKIMLGTDPEHDSHSQLLEAIEWKHVSTLPNIPVSPGNLVQKLELLDF